MYSSLNDAEKYRHHAYDYGWRRVFLEDRNPWSPIDPMVKATRCGKFFQADLAATAERMFRAEQPKSLPASTSWRYRVAAAYRWKHALRETMPRGLSPTDPRVIEAVAEYERAIDDEPQARERAAAKVLIIGDGKNPDGSPTTEAIAFVELCVRQYKANIAEFVERSRKAFQT